MRCKICGEEFYRGTSTLPFNDICTDCHRKCVKYEAIEQSQEEINAYYTGVINSYLKEIKECKKTIQKREELIEELKQYIK